MMNNTQMRKGGGVECGEEGALFGLDNNIINYMDCAFLTTSSSLYKDKWRQIFYITYLYDLFILHNVNIWRLQISQNMP